MPTTAQTFGEPHRYAIKVGYKVFYVLAAIVGSTLGGVLCMVAQENSNSWPLRIVGLAIVAGSILAGTISFSSYVTLSEESVSTGNLFRTRTIRRTEVKGARTVTVKGSTILIIESSNSNDNRLCITYSHYSFDDVWTDWQLSLPDLDTDDRQAALHAIQSDDSLGDSPEARLQKLATAKEVTIGLTAAAIAIAAFLWFPYSPVSPAIIRWLDATLILLPLLAAWIAMRQPQLYTLAAKAKDPRAQLLLVPFGAGIGLLSRLDGVHTNDPATVLACAALPAFILTALYYRVSSYRSLPAATIFTLLFPSMLYGYGAVVQTNTQLDRSPGHEYPSTILNMTVSHGRSTSYHLYLNPWQPGQNPPRVGVSSEFYNSLRTGEQVCVVTHDGALHLTWYFVHHCLQTQPDGKPIP